MRAVSILSRWLNNMNFKFKYCVTQLFLIGLTVVFIAGCRGYRSEKPPIHLNPNMDFNPKFKAQTLSLESPEETIPWGKVVSNEREGFIESGPYHTGSINNAFIKKAPIVVDEALLNRGETRFNIYCAVCHSTTGNGGTPVIERGYVAPPKLSDQRLRNVEDGYLFHVITNGVRSMPGYRSQIPVEDRWAIVTYVRALQKMYAGKMTDVPYSKRVELQKEKI
jgi:mono/diheme cytochrome c family protein